MYEAERALGTTREPGLGAAGPGEPSSGPSLAATVSSGTNRICISIKYDFQVENMDIDGSRAGLGPPGQGSEQPTFKNASGMVITFSLDGKFFCLFTSTSRIAP